MVNLVQLKLVSGEWIVGEVVDLLEPSRALTLKFPLQLHIVQHGPQEYRIVLVPFNPADPEGTIHVEPQGIALQAAKISKALHDEYVHRTTGLELATTMPELEIAK
jgi:hypothetical protein